MPGVLAKPAPSRVPAQVQQGAVGTFNPKASASYRLKQLPAFRAQTKGIRREHLGDARLQRLQQNVATAIESMRSSPFADGNLLQGVVFPAPVLLAGTVSVTNNSTAITFGTAQTLPAGQLLTFASQPGVVYTLSAALNAATAGVLTTVYTGATAAATQTSEPPLSVVLGHGLGRAYRGFFAMNVTGGSPAFQAVAPTTATPAAQLIQLQASVGCTADLWVY